MVTFSISVTHRRTTSICLLCFCFCYYPIVVLDVVGLHMQSSSFLRSAASIQTVTARPVLPPGLNYYSTKPSSICSSSKSSSSGIKPLNMSSSTSSVVDAHNAMPGQSGHDLTKRFPYIPPSWARHSFTNFPTNGRLLMGNFPTPMYRMALRKTRQKNTQTTNSSVLQRLQDNNITLYVKRDDASHGCELTGNKIRKLELLLADALSQNCDSVVTIGGEQSNHCRATACAARMVGLQPHLILRTSRANDILQAQQDDNIETKKTTAQDDSPLAESVDQMGHTGNVLFDRMVGATIYTCTPHEYMRVGSTQLLKRLCLRLTTNTRDHDETKPYPIPVGGSNGLGTFGYLSAVDEMLTQWRSIESQPSLDHVVVACGSGGTAGGIAIGMWLAYDQAVKDDQHQQRQSRPIVHAVGVCDSPDYFYNHVSKIADEMGLVVPPDEESTESYVRKMFIVHSGKGQGYAQSTREELEFISSFAVETGIVLDPVYSGKAMYHFMTHVLEGDPDSFKDKNLLFVHTGGALGLYEQGPSLLPTMSQISPVKRLDLYGKNDSEHKVDISEEVS